MELDKKIAEIQRSTHTLFRPFIPIHEWLRMHFWPYYWWSRFGYSRIVHWTFLFLFICSVFSAYAGINLFEYSGEKTAQATNYDYPRWEWQNPKPTGNIIYAIKAIDANNIWAVGGSGTILKRVNGSWQQQYSGTIVSLKAIDGVDGNNIWAVGDSGTVLKYDGINWSKVSLYPYQTDGVNFSAIKMLGQNNIWLGSSGSGGGKIFFTSDKGLSWQYQNVLVGTLGNISGIEAYGTASDWTAWAFAGNTIYKSSIETLQWGYGQWYALSPDETFGGIRGVKSTDKNTLLIANYLGIQRSTDGGSSWTTIAEMPSGHMYDLTKGFFDSANDFYGYSNSPVTGSNAISVSYVSAEWQFGEIPSSSVLTIDGYNSANFFASAGIGKLFYSSNGSDYAEESSSVSTGAIWSAFALDKRTVYAGGDLGKLLKTTDGGSSWAPETLPGDFSTQTFLSIKGIDANNIWATTTGRKMLKYNGTAWLEQTTGATKILDSLSVVNDQIIWSAGYGGTIKKTINGGESWDIAQTSNTTKDLYSIWGFSDTLAYAVGSTGTIIKTVDGSNWSAETIPAEYSTTYFRNIYATDQNHIWVSGNNVILFYDGNSWTAQLSGLTSTSIYSITGLSAEKIWAFATGGQIFFYNGESWVNQGTNQKLTSNNLYCSAITSEDGQDFIWAVGDKGTIIKYSAPASATATKLLVAYPGQEFQNGVGLVGTPIKQIMGATVPITIYAVDDNNVLDSTNASTVSLTTSFYDKTTVFGPNFSLTQGGECVQYNRQPGDKPCGIGVGSAIFGHNSFTQITARAVTGTLSGTSANLELITGPPNKLRFDSKANVSKNGTTINGYAANAGQPLYATIELLDQYDHGATLTKDISVHLSSEKALLSISQNGPWSNQLDLNYLGDEHSYFAKSFYILITSLEDADVLASSEGLIGDNVTVLTFPGPIDLNRSSVSINNSNPSVGETVEINATVINTSGVAVKDHTIVIGSSYPNTTITQPSSKTSSTGSATGSIETTKSGDLYFSVYDVEDNVYLSTPTISFKNGPVTTIDFSKNFADTPIVAGSILKLAIKLYDRYNNLATVSTDILKFDSSDKQASLPPDYQMTSGEAKDNGSHEFSGFSLKTAGTQTITVTDDNTKAKSSLSFTVLHGTPNSAHSSITTDKNKLIINKEQANLTVLISDEFGNPIANQNIKVNYDNSLGDVKDSGNTKTDDKGEVKFTYKGKKVGKDTLSAYNQTGLYTIGTINIEVLSDTVINQLTSAVDTVQHNPTVKKVAQIVSPIVNTVAAMGLLPLIANMVGSAPATLHALNYGITLALEALGIRRKRKYWGRVFDTTSGKGVDMALVRLFDATNMELVTTAVTDFSGKYYFHPKNGRYVISVSKDGYLFPTELFAKYGFFKKDENGDKKSDIFKRHYIGQPIEIDQANPNLNVDIPIDPVKAKAPFFLKVKLYTADIINVLTFSLSKVFMPLMLLGLLLSAFVQLILPSKKNLIFLAIYMAVTAVYIISREISASKFGFVCDEKGKAIPGASVSIFDKKYNSLKESVITDTLGRFSIAVPKGEYYIRVQKNGWEFTDYKKKDKKHNNKLARFFGKKLIYNGEVLNFKKPQFINFTMKGEEKH